MTIIQKISCIYVQNHPLIFQYFMCNPPKKDSCIFGIQLLHLFSNSVFENSNNEILSKLFGLYDTTFPHSFISRRAMIYTNWKNPGLDKVARHFV